MAEDIGEGGFSKDELFFVKELPEHVEIECPVCLQVMLDDPHLVDCCGHHFCGPCIQRVIASNGPCPVCKEKKYQAVIDKNTLRIINGLQVYCTNRGEDGCQWKGELKNLSTHLNKGKREGDCRYEKVKCRHEACKEIKQRQHLDKHEQNNCPQRPYHCRYCNAQGTYLIINEHYEECLEYPLPCPNTCNCGKVRFRRSRIDTHLSQECPLQPVQCMFSWAGCTDRPLRKDSQSHATDRKHMSLLAVACGKLKSENEKIKQLNEQLEITCGQLKLENYKFKEDNERLATTCDRLTQENLTFKKDVHQLKEKMETVCSALSAFDQYPVLPVTIRKGLHPVHLYTHKFGHHISITYNETSLSLIIGGTPLFIAFHEGKFDKLQPKLPKISVKYDGMRETLVIKEIHQLPHRILTTNKYQSGVLHVDIPSSPSQVEIIASWDE